MAATYDIHPVERPEDLAQFFALAARTFVRDVPVEVSAPDWQRFATSHPRFHAADLRGAFLGGVYAGGYIIEERHLCIGAARVPVGRIGAVVVHPHHRHQGIGTALMWDALAHARARGLAVLLLNGAAHFYTQFGYVDIFDRTDHAIACAEVRGLPAGPYRVRRTTAGDAPALLALYQRHFGPDAGSYDRLPDEQAYLVRFGETVKRSTYTWRGDIEYDVPVLAVDAQQQPRGYLAVPWGPIRSFGCEVACDDWPAALALLQYHAALLEGMPGAQEYVRWPLPPTSTAYYAIADNLPVLSETRQQPHAGWMACIVDAPALSVMMQPEWQQRWRRCPIPGVQGVDIAIEGDVLSFAAEPVPATPASRTPRVELTRAVLSQLLFGYRPVSWAATQAGQLIPPDTLPWLEVLFPPRQTWIPPTDGC